ncbi:MAG: hypothetical protein WD795_16460 [Woeseia sp.]
MKTPQLALMGSLVAATCALPGESAADVPDATTPAGVQGAAASDEPADATPVSAYSCEQEQKFREFDFWIGEWEVRTADGALAGRNVIESSEKGCVLLEKWTSASGGTGISMNYLDKITDEWVQLWIDAGGGQINIRGGLTDAGMLLIGQIHYASNGTTAPFRGLWTQQPDGRLRQFFEQSNDGGETWEPWFEGFYSRITAMEPVD